MLFSTVIACCSLVPAYAGRTSSLPLDVNDMARVKKMKAKLKYMTHHKIHNHALEKHSAQMETSPEPHQAHSNHGPAQFVRRSHQNISRMSHHRHWPKPITVKNSLKDVINGLTSPVTPIVKASIQTRSTSQSPHGNLAAYCGSGGSGSAQEGTTIKGNWKDYGTWYKGTIKEKNADGTYDILYDDGFTEKNVPADNVKTVKTRGNNVNPAKSDPACKLSKDVEELKAAIHDSQKEITMYLQYRKNKKKHRDGRKGSTKGARHKGARKLKEEKKKKSSYTKRKPGESIDEWLDRFWAEFRKKNGGGKDGAKKTAEDVDKDGDKMITKDEVKESYKEQGQSDEQAEESADKFMKKYDKAGTGQISVEDFEKHAEEAEKKANSKEASKVLKELSEKLGGKEAVRKAIDQNEDDVVTKEEVAQALEEKAGKTREESESLAKKIMELLKSDGDSAPADKLEEAIEAASSQEAGGKEESAAYEDVDLSELSDEEKKELIEKLKDEVKDRDEELVEREESLGKFRDKIDEFKDTLSKDHEEEDSRAIPDTPEGKDAEIKRLRAKIMKRAESLDDVLDREEEERRKADYAEAMENQQDGLNQQELLEKMERHSQRIKEMTEKLKAKVKGMKGDGEMDPELEAMVTKVSGAADKMTQKMDKVVTTERKMAARKRAGEDLQDPEAAAAEEEELDKQIEELDQDVQNLKQDTMHIDTEIVPHGDKWWRYRWEYSFVESLMLIMICTIAIFWEGIHRILRRRLRMLSMSSPFFNAAHHHDTMYWHWWGFFTGEMFVLMLVVFTLWIFNRCGIFDWWIEIQFDLFPDMHLPAEARLYKKSSYDIAMQVFFALVCFFGFIFCVVVSATHKEVQWKSIEDPNVPARTSRSMVSLVTDEEEYFIMKEQFMNGINAHPDLEQQAGWINEDTFQFWLYLALNVRHNMTNIYCIRILTWVLLLLTFICFCFFHLYLHMAWIRLWCFFAALLALMFLFMAYKVKQRVVELDTQADTGNVKSFQGESLHEKYNTERMAGTFLQFTIFFLCYGVARIIVSPWLWTYEFWTAVLACVLLIIFAFLFRLFCAPLLVIFIVIMALPPHIDPGNLAVLHEVAIISKEWTGNENTKDIPEWDE